MSDDDLEEDTSNYSEIDHDGVEYLEDEDSGKIYNLNGKLDTTLIHTMVLSKAEQRTKSK